MKSTIPFSFNFRKEAEKSREVFDDEKFMRGIQKTSFIGLAFLLLIFLLVAIGLMA